MGLPWLRGGRIRIAIAVLAALSIGASVGGVAMLIAGAQEAVPQDDILYYGALERLAPPPDDNRSGLDELATGAVDEAADVVDEPSEEAGRTGTQRLVDNDRLFGVDTDGPLPPNLTHRQPGASTAMVDPQLLEAWIGGKLPIIDATGRRPLDAYARPSNSSNVPQIAIVVLDLGLDSKLAADSIQLPSEVGLGFSPYMAHGQEWHRFARSNGHETLLSLPVVHPPEARWDEGPLALHPDLPDAQMETAVKRVLVRGEGYVAVAANSGMFANRPGDFRRVGAILAARGVGLVELGGPKLPKMPDLAQVTASVALDDRLMPVDIENQLRSLERLAQTHGQAIGFTRPYPIVFDRIWHWANELDRSRLNLVPVSALLHAIP